jgi:hypothetical protein
LYLSDNFATSGVINGGFTPNSGFVNFSGALGPVLTVNVTTGLSNIDTDQSGTLDLNSVNVAVAGHTGTDTLYIVLSQTGYPAIPMAVPLGFQLTIGGTQASGTTVTAWGIKDLTNTQWGGVTPTPPQPANTVFTQPGTDANHIVGKLGTFTNNSSSDKTFGQNLDLNHGVVPTYSLTELVKITFAPSSKTQTVSFDFHIHNTVPEPSTLAIGGLAGLGFLVYGLRRRKAQGA